MHGYGYPPGQPPRFRLSSKTLIALRVLFVLLTVLSCGLLAWGPMLWLAIVTRARRDWAVLAMVFVLNVGLLVYIASTPDDPDERTLLQAVIGVTWLFVVMLGSVAYYLYTDIRHFRPSGPYGTSGPYAGGMPGSPAQYGGYPLPQAQAVTPGYGYPPVAPQTPVPQPPIPRTPVPPASVPPPPAATASSVTPVAHPHLDQVRAELDELSEYLRKEGGSR